MVAHGAILIWDILPSLASTLGIVAIALAPGGDEHSKAMAIGALAGLTAPVASGAFGRARGNGRGEGGSPGALIAPTFSEQRR